MLKRIPLIVACSMLFLAIGARADEWDKKTTLTFSQPVELPGVTLPAGTYVFKLANLPGTRNIVHVYNAEENQVFATIIAIPHLTLTPHEKPYIGFQERAAGAPMAIHEWFYPGHENGLEFVYPKARARELVAEFHEPVLAADVRPAQTPAELEEAPVIEITPDNKEVAVVDTFDFNDVPEIADATPVPSLSAPNSATVLPQTASPIPLIALAGLLSLGLAAAMKVLIRNN